MKIQKYKTAIVLPQNLAILSVRVTRHSPPFIFNATTWKRQLGSDKVEATTWKRQLVTLIGFRTNRFAASMGSCIWRDITIEYVNVLPAQAFPCAGRR